MQQKAGHPHLPSVGNTLPPAAHTLSLTTVNPASPSLAARAARRAASSSSESDIVVFFFESVTPFFVFTMASQSYAPPDVTPSPFLVLLHVYDVTNAPGGVGDVINTAVSAVNGFTRGLLGVGGVFHGGLEVYAEEWAFGACEVGSGVYACQPRANPMYKFRETVVLGATALTPEEVKRVVATLAADWGGPTYDLIGRNCCHFAAALAKELGVAEPPGWVNAAAGAADGAARAAAGAARAARDAAKVAAGAARWLVERATPAASEGGSGSGQAAPSK